MRKEIENWWEQAKKDLEVAGKNYVGADYYIACFLCQQAVEKGLKALFILKKGKSPGQTHSLIFLAKEIPVPREFYDLLQSLTPEFIITRYPDVAGDAPFKLYSEEKTKQYLDKARRLLQWIEVQIKKQ